MTDEQIGNPLFPEIGGALILLRPPPRTGIQLTGQARIAAPLPLPIGSE